MKLFLVDHKGWATHFEVVRAETIEQAIELTCALPESVTELTTEGPAKVLWEYEYSPDSRE